MRRFFTISPLVVAITIVLMAADPPETIEPVDLRFWPLPPTPFHVVNDPSKWPAIPTLAPLSTIPLEDGSLKLDEVELKARVIRLAETLPDTTISHLMSGSLNRGELEIDFNPIHEIVGADQSQAQFGTVRAKGPDGQEVLHGLFSLEATPLYRLSTQSEIINYWQTLAHEHQHYLDWLSRDDIQAGFDRPRLGFILPPVDVDAHIKRECTADFIMETEGYAVDCRLALQWHLGWNNDDTCAYVDTLDWNHTVFNYLYPKYDQWYMGKCGRTWAEYIGHPHPEAF